MFLNAEYRTLNTCFFITLFIFISSAVIAQESPELPGAEAVEATLSAETSPDEQGVVVQSVLLQALGKVTARSEELEAPIGALVRFGNLEIVAQACKKSAPEEQPENAALLDVWELKPGESPQRIFRGWMFSSSPSISSLQHPVYDLSVLECRATTIEEVAP